MTSPDWLAQLYEASYRRLVLTAYAFTGDLGESEELVQDAFAVACRCRDKVRGADSPEAWILTVAINAARRRWRRKALFARFLGGQRPDLAAPPADSHLVHADLHAAVRALGTEQRAVVVLHYLADLPVDEVAALLRIPVGTVKSRLARARTSLANQLAQESNHA